MESSSTVIGFLLLSIFLLVMFIARLKIHASIALILSAIFLGTVTRIPLDKLVSTLEDGIGSTLSFLALIMAFGGILGKMLDDSGGAEQIARTLLNRAGKHNAPWVMAVLGSVVGIPIFSDVGFILMAPLAAVVAKMLVCHECVLAYHSSSHFMLSIAFCLHTLRQLRSLKFFTLISAR